MKIIRNAAACLMAAVLGLAIPAMPQMETAAEDDISEGVKNIVARADFLYNMAWTAQKNVKGWRNNYTYKQGTTHHIPYAQPDHKGGYLHFDADFETFLETAADPDSVFYSQQSYNYDDPGSYSTFYGLDCSSMVSYCWELPERTETRSWPSLDATNCGYCNSANVGKLQIGDAINKTYTHVILVTDIFYNQDGTVNSYEITEQTTYEMKRTNYTPATLAQKYSAYTIYRYNQRDSVTPPPHLGAATELDVKGGNSKTETILTWETIISDLKDYTVRIWSEDYSDVTPYIAIGGLAGNAYSVILPAGTYEIRVDATTTSGITFESNTIDLVVYEAEPIPGDVDGNYDLTTADASIVLAAIAEHGASGSYGLDDAQLNAADVNGDGVLSPVDASLILRCIVEWGAGNTHITIADLIG